MIVKEYDLITLLLYCLLALIGATCLYYGHEIKVQDGYKKKSKFSVNKYYLIWFMIWLFFAVFRYVKPEIGGQDAYNYIEYFEKCLEPVSNLYSYRAEPFFRCLTQIMRFIFIDYHMYFVVVYGTLIVGIIKFLDTYYIDGMSVFPTMVAAYVYIYSFNIMRSGWSIGFFLIACSWLKEDKYVRAIVAGVISVLLHTASVFYFPFIVFYILTVKKNKLCTYKTMFFPSFGIMLVVERLSFIILEMVRSGELNSLFNSLGLGQPFDLYANASVGDNFWLDFIQLDISRFQIIPIVLMFIIYIPLSRLVSRLDNESQKSFRFIELSFIYELILLPAIYYFHMWRSPEYFVFIRVIFWGLVVLLMRKSIGNRGANRIILIMTSFCLSMALFIYKINYAWDMSSLMPYYLEPLGLLIDLVF